MQAAIVLSREAEAVERLATREAGGVKPVRHALGHISRRAAARQPISTSNHGLLLGEAALDVENDHLLDYSALPRLTGT